MHLDEEQLQRILHDELAPSVDATVRRHVGECEGCRARVREAAREEEEAFGLLRAIDRPPPPTVSFDTIAWRARRRDHTWMRRAAAVLAVMVGAGAAYAAPGSPLPDLLRRLVGAAEDGPRPRAPADSLPTLPATSGVAVDPGESFTIVLAPGRPGGTVTVALTDDAELVVQAKNGRSSFASDVNRLTITTVDLGDISIAVPRGAPRVEVRVGPRRVFLKAGAIIESERPRDARGRYTLRWGPP